MSDELYNVAKGMAEGTILALKPEIIKAYGKILTWIKPSNKTESENLDAVVLELNETESKEYLVVIPDIGVPIIKELLYKSEPRVRKLLTKVLFLASQENSRDLIHPFTIGILTKLTDADLELFEKISISRSKTIIELKYNFVNEKENTFQASTIKDLIPEFMNNLNGYYSLNHLLYSGVLEKTSDVPVSCLDDIIQALGGNFKSAKGCVITKDNYSSRFGESIFSGLEIKENPLNNFEYKKEMYDSIHAVVQIYYITPAGRLLEAIISR